MDRRNFLQAMGLTPILPFLNFKPEKVKEPEIDLLLKEPEFVMTGIPEFDENLGGFRTGSVNTIWCKCYSDMTYLYYEMQKNRKLDIHCVGSFRYEENRVVQNICSQAIDSKLATVLFFHASEQNSNREIYEISYDAVLFSDRVIEIDSNCTHCWVSKDRWRTSRYCQRFDCSGIRTRLNNEISKHDKGMA